MTPNPASLCRAMKHRNETGSRAGSVPSGVSPASPTDDASAGTWDSGSDISASVISASSNWTDNSTNDRSSRRALILQMAKARMNSNKVNQRSSVASPERDAGYAMDQLTEASSHDDGSVPHENVNELDFAVELD